MGAPPRDWMTATGHLLQNPPGPDELETTSDADLIDLIAAVERAKGTLSAVQARAELTFRESQIAKQRADGVPREQLGRGVGDQIALARRITPKQASDQVALRRILVETLPRTTGLLEKGEISEWAAHEVAKNVLVLEDEDRETLDDELEQTLPTMTANRASRVSRARAQELDPNAAVERARRKVADRNVSLRAAPDGMSILSALLPQKEGVAAYAALTREAKARKAKGDERGKGQIMADTLVERTTGLEETDQIPVEVNLLMTDETLLNNGDDTAWIDGHPVPGRLARDVALGVDPGTPPPRKHRWYGTSQSEPSEPAIEATAAESPDPAQSAQETAPPPKISDAARWIRRLYADPVTGELRAADSRRRFFGGAARRFILLRDQRCRTPWCDAPIHDLDHVHRYADGGETSTDNGLGYCQRFNLAREIPGWKSSLEPSTDGRSGTLTIITPTGHTYESRAPRLQPEKRTRTEAAPGVDDEPAEKPFIRGRSTTENEEDTRAG